MPPFNLESYHEHSKKVDVSDLDFAEAAKYPLSADEIRCLTYMMWRRALTRQSGNCPGWNGSTG